MSRVYTIRDAAACLYRYDTCLVVDDLPERAAFVADALYSQYWMVVRAMPREVFEHLAADIHHYNAVCLDFDMCENPDACPNPSKYGGCKCPTGLDVARWLRQHKYDGRVVLISANPVGLRRMKDELSGLDVHECSAVCWTNHRLAHLICG